MFEKKKFNYILIFVNLNQDVKNQAIPSICFRDIVQLEILQFEWLRGFCSISQDYEFPKNDVCTGTKQTTSIFAIEQNQYKSIFKLDFQ